MTNLENSSSIHNKYRLNQVKTSFLPTFFTGLVSLILVFILLIFANTFFYIEIFAQNVPLFQTKTNYNLPQNLIQAELSKNEFTTTPKIFEKTENQVESFKAGDCVWQILPSKPPGIAAKIEVNSVWWSASNCANLNTIQVIQTGNPQLASLNQDEVQSLAGVDLIWYGPVTVFSEAELEIFKASFVVGEVNFDPSLAKTSYRIDDEVFYLSGLCNSPEAECQLWFKNKFTEKYTLITDKLFRLQYLEKPLLSINRNLEFDTQQKEYPSVLNLKLTENNSSSYWLIRIDLRNNSLLQILEFANGQLVKTD